MKKKLFSVLLALAAMPAAAFSADETIIDNYSADKSGSISVDYDLDVSYTVTIPANVTFTDTEKTADRALEAKNVVLNEGGHLDVNVTSLNNFQMVNDSGYIDYNMQVNGSDISRENGVTILTVKAGETSGWAVLTFSTNLSGEHSGYAGKYSDILTFTVQVN